MPETSQQQYTKRVAGRTTLARQLREPKYASVLRRVGLRVADLDLLVTQGEAAAGYDRQQHVELAEKRQEQQAILEMRAQVEALLEGLRNRLPATVADLAAAADTRALAAWLQGVSFERFRIKVTVVPAAEVVAAGAPAATGAAEPAAATRERVARDDLFARFDGATQLVASLLEPARAPILQALEERGLDRPTLERLGQDAARLSSSLGGKAWLTKAAATRLEAEAVAAQKVRWDVCRRMLRAAVEGDETLQKLWAEC
jgi:hypothetical protein